jgi:hypothetical protein
MGRGSTNCRKRLALTQPELHGRLGLRVRGGGIDALIENRHDVAADRSLHLDAGFGREQVGPSIHVTLENARPLRPFPWSAAARISEILLSPSTPDRPSS